MIPLSLSCAENYSLFDPPTMYSDEELEAWGELYCKLALYAKGAPDFVRFMALPLTEKRRCLRAALNPPRPYRRRSAFGVAEPIPRSAGDTSGRCVGADNTRSRGRAPSIGPVTRHL